MLTLNVLEQAERTLTASREPSRMGCTNTAHVISKDIVGGSVVL